MKLKRILLIVNLLMAGLAVLSGARFVETFFYYSPEKAHKGEGSKDTTPSPGQAVGNQPRAEESRLIVQRDIFGARKPGGGPGGNAAESIRPTSLDLVLKGTVLGENERSYAIIADSKTRVQETYGLNDFVQGGRVVDILKDKVVLSVKGSREVLEMEERADKQGPRPALTAPADRTRSPIARKAPAQVRAPSQ